MIMLVVDDDDDVKGRVRKRSARSRLADISSRGVAAVLVTTESHRLCRFFGLEEATAVSSVNVPADAAAAAPVVEGASTASFASSEDEDP